MAPADAPPRNAGGGGADGEADRTACIACGATAARQFTAREQMFGTGETFDYLECGRCGSLQIAGVPAGLARHYGDAYYSFAAPRSRVTRFLRGRRAAAVLGRGGWMGHALASRFGVPADLRAVAGAALPADAAVLDVGCGSGAFALDLHAAGVRHVEGVDPFVASTVHYPGGVTVWRRTLDEHAGSYTLVMMHHSLEHMAHPLGALREAGRLLGPGGRLLVRLPVAATHAWRTYGPHWVQLDAPRHVFLPSEAGFRALAARGGLVVEGVTYDSEAFQFWGSELYRQQLSLVDARGRRRTARDAGYSAAQLRALDEQARRLNDERDGDQACFYLRRASDVDAPPLDQPKS